MDEYVLPAIVGLNKSIALRRVEPLHCTNCHGKSPQRFETQRMVTEIRRKKGPLRCTRLRWEREIFRRVGFGASHGRPLAWRIGMGRPQFLRGLGPSFTVEAME